MVDIVTAFHQNIKALLDSIEDCLTKRRIIPCLILLYSGMDTISMLESGRASRKNFKQWVAKYVLKQGGGLNCTADDLYAARCGILHTFSAESDLSRAGDARRIVYAWGNAEVDSLARALTIQNRVDCAIHVRQLVDAFRNGLAEYLEDAAGDENRLRKVFESASFWFTNMSKDRIEMFLTMHDSVQSDSEP